MFRRRRPDLAFVKPSRVTTTIVMRIGEALLVRLPNIRRGPHRRLGARTATLALFLGGLIGHHRLRLVLGTGGTTATALLILAHDVFTFPCWVAPFGAFQ